MASLWHPNPKKQDPSLFTKTLYVIERLKFIYSEKATKFWEISTIDLSYVVTVKSTVEILQNFVAFSEYMNFKKVQLQKSFFKLYPGTKKKTKGSEFWQT